MKLLSVDWDFFFPTPDPNQDIVFTPFDWTLGEGSPVWLDLAWLLRAATFQARGMELPTVHPGYKAFWQEFRLAPGVQVYVADSHRWAGSERVKAGVTEVWSYDAHHDLGYKHGWQAMLGGQVTCENWLLWYAAVLGESRIHVRYPTWKSLWWWSAEPPESMEVEVDRGTAFYRDEPAALPTFDRVFICRSSGFTPNWLDAAFTEFVQGAPAPATVLEPLFTRTWPDARVAELAADERLMLDFMAASHTILRREGTS